MDPNQSYSFINRSLSRTTNDATLNCETDSQSALHINQEDKLVEIQLNDSFFSGVNWMKALECLKCKNDQSRNVLGIKVVESDILWRYFKKQN